MRESRKQNGLNQSDLGLRQAAVSSFESNPENIAIGTLFKLLSINGLEMHIVPKGMEMTESKQRQVEW
ncbi:transcriptional regulator [Vibrio splendidus]|nr:transcriptional regulator [Vibrio splendidus]MCC4882755.1 transcriptional regulator [Vibrio splendidus]